MDVRPSQQMRDLGVVQYGAAILAEPARAFDLPAERDEAGRITDELFAAMERISQVHPFAKGMGIAAPQIGIAVQPQSSNRQATSPPSSCSIPGSPTAPKRRTSSTRAASASSTSAASSPAP
ncbi:MULTISPECIES: peptide deformylase [Streptomyces]|uniref:peptide deformylase n=1 Tax=Streptomyces TaxID=1883 RepID=UPI00207BC9B7|nr:MULTISPECIES: peptide deformylase [Streptomyces]MCO8307235.1 peptide deformylase [Streptomyces sp. RKCA744]